MIKAPIMSKKTTIIGAGWLGKPLAKALASQGFDVIATNRNAMAAMPSSDTSKAPYAIQFVSYSDELLHKILQTAQSTGEYGQYSALCRNLFANRKVVITIPPSPFLNNIQTEANTQQISPFSYAEMISHTAQLAQQFGATEIIFTSSTSVYGNSSGIIHEALPAMPKTANAKAIREAEIALETNRSIPVTILRLAGLIGNGRHPIRHLSGRTEIAEPLNAINLLHIDDLMDVIKALLLRDKGKSHFEIFNIATPYHPNRQSYYQTLAATLSLPLPEFEMPRPVLKRIIDGQKITENGDFHYKHIDLLHASAEEYHG